MSTFNNVSFEKFKSSAKEFFDGTNCIDEIDVDQAVNGHKALGLLYFGKDKNWTEGNILEEGIIIRMATKRCIQVRIANKKNELNLHEE